MAPAQLRCTAVNALRCIDGIKPAVFGRDGMDENNFVPLFALVDKNIFKHTKLRADVNGKAKLFGKFALQGLCRRFAEFNPATQGAVKRLSGAAVTGTLKQDLAVGAAQQAKGGYTDTVGR